MASYRLKETLSSLSDLDKIAIYYEKQRLGLGSRFANYYYRQIGILKTMPHIGRKGKVKETKELILYEFPFLVVYRVKGEIVELLRILHQMEKYPK